MRREKLYLNQGKVVQYIHQIVKLFLKNQLTKIVLHKLMLFGLMENTYIHTIKIGSLSLEDIPRMKLIR